ncbi:preprotein translocase subunit YajC [Lactobacillus sp. CC-MHH1034]|nr:preprotein translocase subunit YajC [Agrilactobacillus fermenti]
MGVVMYFSMIRPQKKQQQKRQEMFSQMKKGDRIVTIGGLHGVIDSVDTAAKTVVIDSDGIYLTFNISAIRDVQANTAVPTGTTSAPAATAETKNAAPASTATETKTTTDTTDTNTTEDKKSE